MKRTPSPTQDLADHPCDTGYRLRLLNCHGVSFFAVSGTVGLHDCGAFERDAVALASGLGGRVVLDLTALAFINVIGLGVVVRLGNLIQRSGGQMMLHGANPRVCKLIRQTRLHHVFPPIDSIAQTTNDTCNPPTHLATCA